MRCWKCGTVLRDGQELCGNCGARLKIKMRQDKEHQDPAGGVPANDVPAKSGKENGDMVLKTFALVMAAVYGMKALQGAWSLLGILSGMFLRKNLVSSMTSLVFGALLAIAGAMMCISLLLTATKRTRKNSDGLLLCAAASGAAIAAVRLLRIIVTAVLYSLDLVYASFPRMFGSFFRSLLGAAFTVAGIYLIRRFMLGEEPLAGKNKDQLTDELREAFSSAKEAAGEAGTAVTSGTAAAGGDISSKREAGQAKQRQAVQPGGGRNNAGLTRMDTGRSILPYIVLSILTCGIYSWFFTYSLAEDVGILCNEDGDGAIGTLPHFIVLNLVTCGLYSWFWYYSLGNRLATSSERYGLDFRENGNTVLLWCIAGSFVCGIGPFIAMHILIKNTNALSTAYNRVNGL